MLQAIFIGLCFALIVYGYRTLSSGKPDALDEEIAKQKSKLSNLNREDDILDVKEKVARQSKKILKRKEKLNNED